MAAFQSLRILIFLDEMVTLTGISILENGTGMNGIYLRGQFTFLRNFRLTLFSTITNISYLPM